MLDTIIGPWKRLNSIQEKAIKAFIPRVFLRLIGASRITDVALGNYVQKDLTVMLLKIRGFAKLTSNMNAEQIFQFLNNNLDLMGPLVRRRGGFVHAYEGDGFLAIFESPKTALRASVDIQNALDSYNSVSDEKVDQLPLSIALHSGRLLLGILGERERMQGTIVSQHYETVLLLERLANKYETNILITKTIVQKSEKDIRFVGSILVNSNESTIEVYDVLQKRDEGKLATKDYFEQGVSLFQRGLYENALEQFEKVLTVVPNDRIAYSYAQVCHQRISTCKYIYSTCTITTILRDEALLNGFKQFSSKEKSDENISFWIDIESFKRIHSISDRRKRAEEMRNRYLSLSGNSTVNINERLKDTICDNLSQPDQVIDQSLFDTTQTELEILMKDTLKRFKESEEFTQCFQESTLAPKIPLLDELLVNH
jgi:class 3 adenylate cyclase